MDISNKNLTDFTLNGIANSYYFLVRAYVNIITAMDIDTKIPRHSIFEK